MINVNGLKRNAKNIVKKYSDAQVKVREATSNDPWGPSSTIMSEIADLTYNVVAFSEIMQMIWKRLNDHGKNWRHVYKALVLLEYLIKTGTEKVAQQCIENIFAIQTLKDFQYMEDNKDYGMNIREKSKKMVALLKDSEKLKAERARALKAKSRLAESMSSVGKSGLQGSIGGAGAMGDMSSTNNGSSSNGGNYMNYHNDSGGSSSSAHHLQDGSGSGLVNSDLDSARPQTLTEEENQLKLALALSKEEAEQQEKTRKNDELRLKLALDVSKKTASSSLIDDFNEPSTGAGASSSSGTLPKTNSNVEGQSASSGPSKSTIDDLLGLSIPPPAPEPATSIGTNNMSPFSNFTSHLPASNLMTSSAFPEPQNDPWSADPWSTMSNNAAIQSQAPSVSLLTNPTNPLSTLGIAPIPPLTQQPPLASTQFNNNNNSIFNNLVSTNYSAVTANKPRPVSNKNPFED